MPWELPAFLDEDLAREGWTELQTMARLQETIADLKFNHHRVSALETTWYMRNQLLRDTDWAGMAHFLEIRVPLVDLQLLRTASPLVESCGVPGKQAMAKTPARPLPDGVLSRDKTGFIVPVRQRLVGKNNNAARGLRGWATHVYQRFTAQVWRFHEKSAYLRYLRAGRSLSRQASVVQRVSSRWHFP